MSVSADRRPDTVSFGPFILAVNERLLTKDGVVVDLGTRALDLLITFALHPNEVMSKRELLAQAWPDVTVEEGSLRFQIASLRKAIGDGVDGVRYITTLTGRGYCFVAPVSVAKNNVERRSAATPCLFHANMPNRSLHVIGRQNDIAILSEQLSAHRFVTIVGAGGVGKTTVAVELVHDLADTFEDAVLFVDLSTLSNSNLVAPAVASMLGLTIQSDDPTPGVIAYLRDKKVLLIFDTCEHLIDAVAALAANIFDAAPQVHILATSREALRVEGERIYRLTPLACPPENAQAMAAVVQDFPATQLFIERAAANGNELNLTDADAEIVARICRQLDGVALAIELAARRVEAYGLQQVAAYLDQTLALSWAGARNAPARQKTLLATLNWSYGLLTEQERIVLRRLAIFVGDFTIKAALAVVTNEAIDEAMVFSSVDSLVAKSIVATRPVGAMMRYRLLDTTRAYVLDLGEGDIELAARHAAYFRYWLEESGNASSVSVTDRERISHLVALNNVRAALEWCFGESGDVAIGIAIATAAAPHFLALSLPGECHRWCERALIALDDSMRGGVEEMRLQSALGLSLMFTDSSSERARECLNRSLEIAEARGDAIEQLQLLAPLHMFHGRLGDFKTMLRYGFRSAAVSKQLEDPDAFALGHALLGMSLHLTGELSDARIALDASLDRASPRTVSNTIYLGFNGRSVASAVLARTLWLQGFPEQALTWARRNVQDAVATDHPVTLCVALIWAVSVFLWTGDLESAAENVALFKARAKTASLGPYLAVAEGFEGELALRRGDPNQGADSLEACLIDLHAARYELLSTPFKISLVEGFVATDRVNDAHTLVEEAIAVADTYGHASYMPELLRMKSRVLLAMPEPDIGEVERILLQSLDISRNQTAHAWELRTATDLAALRARQGMPEAAYNLLRPIYDGFVEGFDTADLKVAHRLLASLHG